tara:strand:+ start:660 stop:1283 length:624 start_codon:yes stop_codon:yes gene_type:complete
MNLFDSAWQLLKYAAYHEDDDYDDDDDVDPRKNPGYNEEDLMLDDMDDAILEHEIRQLRQSPGFYDKPEPAVTEEERKEEELKQHIADYLQSQKLASQPMDLAWQLLKANPSWMRRDANKGRIHTEILPNPFDPNYQEQIKQRENQRKLKRRALDNYGNAMQQMLTLYPQRGLAQKMPKLPTEASYEENEENQPPVIDEEYEKYYSQ